MRYCMTVLTSVTLLCTCVFDAVAEVVSASDTHFVLRLEAESKLAPQELWHRLVEPATWWDSDHTYSGDANNLTLDLRAGGLWAEKWTGGAVEHGRVILVQNGSVLRMVAPFGPLQSVGAHVVWTISLASQEGGAGTVVRFDEFASGPVGASLNELAPAVEGVKRQALERLVNPAVTR